jgi:ABC transporter substrate binding protein (PQQ-dependent alcohol dehydrogenase system)
MFNFRYRMRYILFGFVAACLGFDVIASQLSIPITYLSNRVEPSYAINDLLVRPANAGIAGAELGIADSNTTGKFLDQRFVFLRIDLAEQKGSKINWSDVLPMPTLLLVDLDTETLFELLAYNSELVAPHLIINVSARSNALRQTICSEYVFHTTPSYAQITDALGQWLLMKRLDNIFLIDGDTSQDAQWLESFKRTAKRYKLTISTEKKWSFNSDLRRTVGQEIPLFTQTARPYDVVVVADTHQRFGQYIPFNTYYPRPVVGSAGLVANTWHPSIEQWGAKQLQHRFMTLHDRYMQHHDYDSYVAIRAIAYAVQQTASIDPSVLSPFLRGDKFQLAAYKGRKLTFRNYNGQLRMPIELTHPLGLVSRSPQAGFMHPLSELDTLGFDKSEVCQ